VVPAVRKDVDAMTDAVRLEMYQSMYLSVAAKWASVLDAADKAEDVQPDEVIESLRRIDPALLEQAINDGTDALDREMIEQGVQPTHERVQRLCVLITAAYARLAALDGAS
jgi:hypothetical protein